MQDFPGGFSSDPLGTRPFHRANSPPGGETVH